MNLASEINNTQHYSREFNEWISNTSASHATAMSFVSYGLHIGFIINSGMSDKKLSGFASGQETASVTLFSAKEKIDGSQIPIKDHIAEFLNVSSYYNLVLHDVVHRDKNIYVKRSPLAALYDFLYLVEVLYRDKVVEPAKYYSCLTSLDFFAFQLNKEEVCELYRNIMKLINSKKN